MNYYPRGTAVAGTGLTLGAGRLPFRHSAAALFSLFVTLLLAGGSAQAAIINAKSGLLGDVTVAVNAAANGDTVAIPVGTFTWTSSLIINKAITLQGAGIGKTIIRDAGSGQLTTWTLVANKPSRMTGIEFQDGGRTVAMWGNQVNGSNTNGSTMRIDNCKFDHLKGFAINPNDMIGVIDHNILLFSPGNMPIYAFHKNWNDQGPYSGGSWADSSHFGTSQFLFIEDNTFVADSPYAAFDCYGGARIVFRYNNVTRGHCEIHGTESATIFRGGRAFEIYNNTFIGPTLGDYTVNGRSGVFVVHDNQTTGISNARIELVYYRTTYPFMPWGVADGTSMWDVNLPGGPFYSGTAISGTPTGGSFGYPTVTVSGSPWTPNQWKGYSINKTSAESSTQKASLIFENTTNTITFLPPIYPPGMQFGSGNTFTLYKVAHALDQPGRSRGSLIPQVDPPTPPSGWNNQVTEPCYEWNNTKTEGGSFHFSASPYDKLIRVNEHYFNGTVKLGYTPYTYPHPLVSGAPTPTPTPAPPANLHVIGP